VTIISYYIGGYWVTIDSYSIGGYWVTIVSYSIGGYWVTIVSYSIGGCFRLNCHKPLMVIGGAILLMVIGGDSINGY
jgi:hypothetical protein